MVAAGTPPAPFSLNPERFEYGLENLMGKAWLFYEAQRSGKLPPDNRIAWRGDSYEKDGSEHVPPVDLSGGWYDAGDTLKLSMPLCASVKLLPRFHLACPSCVPHPLCSCRAPLRDRRLLESQPCRMSLLQRRCLCQRLWVMCPGGECMGR